jgi:PAS domain S-box-containing protein
MLLARLPGAELIEVNDTFTRLTGFTREQALGRTTLDLGVWTDLTQRQHFLEQIRHAGKVREFEAEFAVRGGERRWMSLTADVVQIDGHPCMLTVGIDVTDRHRRDLFQETTYRISEAAAASDDLPALFRKLHGLIGGLMAARNLYFALVSPDGKEVSFPYFEDERSACPAPRPRGKGLTDFVIDSKQTLLARQEELRRRLKEQGYTPTGTPSAVWLGAPLVVRGQAIGVIAVQDYKDESVYGDEEKRLLTFVAEQAAAAVERRRTEDALRKAEAERRASQEYFEKSFNASPALMAITRLDDGVLLQANAAFLAAVEMGPEQALGRAITDLGIWLDGNRRLEYRRGLETGGQVRDFAARFRNRRGVIRDMVINADVIAFAHEKCVVVVALDVTERRRREREQDAIYRISAAAQDASDPAALFARVEAIFGEILSAQTFYVSLYDEARNEISYPLWRNARQPAPPTPKPPGLSLTSYVIRTGQPLGLTHADLPEFTARTGHAPLLGTFASWLAVPLLRDGRTIGTIGLIDYDDPAAHRPEDQQLLAFIASQIATALRRVEVEAARRESQEYFTKSFHASPALMLLAGLDTGRILEVNAAFCRASGFSREEAVGRTSLELGLWPDPAERAHVMRRLAAERAVHDYGTKLLNKSGEPRYVLLNADLIELAGRPSMLVTAIDLTDRHRQEKIQDATYRISRAVLASGDLATLFAELHRTVASLMPAKNFYVALLDSARGVLTFPYFADEKAPPAGFSPTPRPLGLGFTDFVIETAQTQLATSEELVKLFRARGAYEPPPHPPALRLGAPLLVEGKAFGVIAIHDYENPRAYGEEEKRLLTFVAEQAAAAVERRRAEDAMRKAEERYRGIFENALEGLYTSTPEGRFLNVNPAFARMLGYDTPAHLLATIGDIGREFYAEKGRRAEFFRQLGFADEVTDFESQVYGRDGRKIWISESVRAVRDAQGRVDHLEGVAVDITDQRETARVLQAAKESADSANRAKSQFLASMSHELRTPLNGILGYTQILRRDSALTDKQRSGVGIIQDSAEHLLALINDVLDLAKIEARKLELHATDFDLPAFARAVADFFLPRAREKNLLLEANIAPDLPRHVRGDVQRLRQVCYNLLSNAVKFTARGSVIFTVERAGGRIRFSVSDTGPGIAPDDQALLFEPFAQIGDHTRHAEGTGLGLNVSRGIVEQMGGKLQLDSRPGWGSRFWFEIDLPGGSAGSSAAPEAGARRVIGYAGARRKVLVADDHEANRQLLKDLLAPLGFEVRGAPDGAAAIQQARTWQPDFILLDLKMPKLDGFAAARAIRKALPEATTRIVGMSASAFESDRQACLDAGCAEFLPKPLREAQLLGALERQLGLAWEYAGNPAETASPFPAMEHMPAIADADTIYDLACKGDVVAVRAHAQKIAEDDPRLAPFAQAVTDLASRFKMKAIRNFVGRYRAGGTGRPFPEN